jgi:hypothetical protein
MTPCVVCCKHLAIPESELCAICGKSPAFEDDVLALRERFPQATYVKLAKDFGVSQAKVTRWIKNAMRRKGLRP